MKLHNKIKSVVCMAAASLAVMSCDNDHKPDWPASDTTEISFIECSIAEGSEVNAENLVIEFTYSHPVAFNNAQTISLNDEILSTNDNTVSTEGNKLTISFTTLESGTAYHLVLNERCVAGVGCASFAPAVTLNFTTAVDDTAVVPEKTLTNPNASAQAKAVYNYLVQQQGKGILSGAMANVNNNNDFAGWIKAKTGKDVAITCYDFIHLPESGQNWINYSDITPAETQWNANGLVSYMWHWRVPTDEQAWRDGDFNRYGTRVPGTAEEETTDFDIERAVQNGTWENDFVLADIDKVAAVLKQLQEKGIPVIWRPLHEAAGSYKYSGAWFWWGRKGGEATKALWRLMYDRLVNHHGLNNLIWVWTAQYEEGYESNMTADYPGNEYVDVVGTDIYADNDNSQKAAYDALHAMCGGMKLIAISETGLVQNPEKCLADGAEWSWFNIWYSYNIHESGDDTDTFGNTAASLKAIFESPLVINRDNLPSFK